MIGLIGLIITSVGLAINAQKNGSIAIKPRQTVEAYQRGRHTPVDHHLGGPLSFDLDGQKVIFNFGGKEHVFDYYEFVSGSTVHIAPWSLQLIGQSDDMQNPSITLKFQHRKTQEIDQVVLRLGESKLIDNKMGVRVDQVLNNPPKNNQPSNLQVALYAQWKDQNNQPIQKPIYIQSSFPELDQRFGQSPYITTVEGIKPTPEFRLSVQPIPDPTLVRAGMVILLLALSMMILETVRTQNSANKSAT